MKKTLLTAVLLLCASVAQADLYQSTQTNGTVNFSDRLSADQAGNRLDKQITNPLVAGDLPGIWKASSANGNKTELTLRGNGSFVFDQSSEATLHHLYMCGTWQGDDDALSLVVKALKRQLENGEIEQTDGTHREQATILSAQQDRIILLIQGEKLVFNRVS